MSFFTPAVRGELSQGDIFDIALSAVAGFPLDLLTGTITAKGNIRAHTFETVHQESAAHREVSDDTARITIARGMLISHDCQIDYEHRYRTVAMLRPMPLASPDSREVIRRNADYRFFYVPETDMCPESYVNLRRITTVPPSALRPENRIASLSDESRAALCTAIVLFFTRRELVG